MLLPAFMPRFAFVADALPLLRHPITTPICQFSAAILSAAAATLPILFAADMPAFSVMILHMMPDDDSCAAFRLAMLFAFDLFRRRFLIFAAATPHEGITKHIVAERHAASMLLLMFAMPAPLRACLIQSYRRRSSICLPRRHAAGVRHEHTIMLFHYTRHAIFAAAHIWYHVSLLLLRRCHFSPPLLSPLLF